MRPVPRLFELWIPKELRAVALSPHTRQIKRWSVDAFSNHHSKLHAVILSSCAHTSRRPTPLHTLLTHFQQGKVHGSLARAGKVKSSTPKVDKTEKPKKPKGRAYKRLQYTNRFVNAAVAPNGKRKMNSNAP